MAALGEVPFAPLLRQRRCHALVRDAGRRLRASAPATMRSSRELWPAIESALAWIDGPGDLDGDGFVEYARGAETGLSNQGWKDSHDSVFHADGSLAEGPIALVEVQGYVYAARLAASMCARALGLEDRADSAGAAGRAAARSVFEERFWCDEHRHLRPRAGRRQARNAGCAPAIRATRCSSGIVAPERGAVVASALLRQRFLLRLGHPHRGPGRGALQSDVLSQRLDLAARQRADRARPRPRTAPRAASAPSSRR